MRSLIEPSYEHEPAMFAHDVECCDRAYLLRGEGGQLVAFFLAAFLPIVEDRPLPSVYLGLSAVSDVRKNSGIVRQLFERFTADAIEFERTSKAALFMFGTLATPSSYRATRIARKGRGGGSSRIVANIAHVS
jgi:hypothetical protein